MGFILRGLDGVSRDSAEVFASSDRCAARQHGLLSIAGYIVRRTFPGDASRAQEDIAEFSGPSRYAEALELAKATRKAGRLEIVSQWAVIDTVYDCGCRGMG